MAAVRAQDRKKPYDSPHCLICRITKIRTMPISVDGIEYVIDALDELRNY
jgi:hypothetical protein